MTARASIQCAFDTHRLGLYFYRRSSPKRKKNTCARPAPQTITHACLDSHSAGAFATRKACLFLCSAVAGSDGYRGRYEQQHMNGKRKTNAIIRRYARPHLKLHDRSQLHLSQAAEQDQSTQQTERRASQHKRQEGRREGGGNNGVV